VVLEEYHRYVVAIMVGVEVVKMKEQRQEKVALLLYFPFVKTTTITTIGMMIKMIEME